MPLVIFLILVVLIAMFGFWDTLSALLGSLMMIILFAAAAAGLLVLYIIWKAVTHSLNMIHHLIIAAACLYAAYLAYLRFK